MEVSGQHHAPAAVPPLPTEQETEWVSELFGCFFGEGKHLLSLPGIQPARIFIFHILWIFIHC